MHGGELPIGWARQYRIARTHRLLPSALDRSAVNSTLGLLPSDFRTKNVVTDYCQLSLFNHHNGLSHEHAAKVWAFVFSWLPSLGWFLAKPFATISSTTMVTPTFMPIGRSLADYTLMG